MTWSDFNLSDDTVAVRDGPAIVHEIDDGAVELSSWAVFLPEGQVRYYHWFRYREMPALRLQEMLCADPSPNYHGRDYTGRLLWEREGLTYTATPTVKLAGGQTAGELDEFSLWWYEHELERLGHIHYSPWYSFSIPHGAEALRGYLAYTLEEGEALAGAEGNFYEYAYVFLHHQANWLHYPFVSILDLGGQRYAAPYGPMQAVYGIFEYYGPVPY